MATISITIPDAAMPRIIAAYCALFGYQAVLEDGTPNPETKAAFTKRMVIRHVRGIVTSYEGDTAVAAVRVTTAADVDSITIT